MQCEDIDWSRIQAIRSTQNCRLADTCVRCCRNSIAPAVGASQPPACDRGKTAIFTISSSSCTSCQPNFVRQPNNQPNLAQHGLQHDMLAANENEILFPTT